MSSLPKCFKANNKELSENKDIANGFNNFFANVGPNLAKTIPACEGKSFYDYMVNNVRSFMFLQPTCESKINNVIRVFQNKTSSGHDGISMNIGPVHTISPSFWKSSQVTLSDLVQI